MEKVSLISTDIVQDSVTDALRRYVGRSKEKSVSELASQTGVSDKTIYAVLESRLTPSFETILKIAAELPPTFMSEAIRPAGLGGVETIEGATVDASGTMADLSRHCAEMADRLRDGKFCHQDRAAMGPQLIELARLLESQGRAMIERNVTTIR